MKLPLQVFSADEGRSEGNVVSKSCEAQDAEGAPVTVWFPFVVQLPGLLARAWLSCPHHLAVFPLRGCHEGGAEVNGAKSWINLRVLTAAAPEVWLQRGLSLSAKPGLCGGAGRKVKVSKRSPASAGFPPSYFAERGESISLFEACPL